LSALTKEVADMRKALLVLPFLLAISVGVATATAGGGNSANAKLCQMGGWMNLQGSDGTQFTSEEQCVAFAAEGLGTIVPKPSVSFTYTPTDGGTECLVMGTMSHFAPNTEYLALLTSSISGVGVVVTTDLSGAGSFPGIVVAGTGRIVVTISVLGNPATVYSGQGVC
jgi:hypothetical protein